MLGIENTYQRARPLEIDPPEQQPVCEGIVAWLGEDERAAVQVALEKGKETVYFPSICGLCYPNTGLTYSEWEQGVDFNYPFKGHPTSQFLGQQD